MLFIINLLRVLMDRKNYPEPEGAYLAAGRVGHGIRHRGEILIPSPTYNF